MNAKRRVELGTKTSADLNACGDRCRKLRLSLRNSRRLISREHESSPEGERHLTQLALNEAEALAWQTGVPELVFPALAEEKVQALATWRRRQRLLRPQPPAIEGFSA